MITVLSGDNTFEVERTLKEIEHGFEGKAERIDGAEVSTGQLPDLFMGTTLFASKRLVIVRGLSLNKKMWTELPEWLPRIADDVHVILVEPKLDKRTKTYKILQKESRIQEFLLWGERDTAKAEQWVAGEATRQGFALDKKSAHHIVTRIGVDQWLLYQALVKLAVLEKVNEEVIDRVIEATPQENVFLLFETALKGDVSGVAHRVAGLSATEDPFRLFGLLGGQAFQLAALVLADKSSSEIARDIGVHPFALSKLAPYAKRMGRGGVRQVTEYFAEADKGIKTSAVDPWLLIERALVKVARI